MPEAILETIRNFLEQYPTVAPVFAVVIRTISVIIPPIPSTSLDAVFLVVFGRLDGFIYTEIGSMIGSSVNFFIARRFREPAVRKFMPLEKIRAWEERIRTRAGFWGLVSVRIATTLIFDYISYIAGLTNISYGKFLATSFLANAVFVGCFYYFGGAILAQGMLWTTLFLVPIVILFILMQKGRIFRRFRGYVNVHDETDNMPL